MNKPAIAKNTLYPDVDISLTSDFILDIQKPNGEIPWSKGGKTDLWDHVESAMALTVGGYHEEAKKAYLWCAEMQLDDGSWWSYYEKDAPQEKAYKDSNMSAYIAVGVLHHYLITGDYDFLKSMWSCVSQAMDYVVGMQAEGGEILWAKRSDGSIDRKALLTGSSSIYLSLNRAISIAELMNEEKPHWEISRIKLGRAIKYNPHLFDLSKSRFSMDWYYPILCGALKGEEARKRITKFWDNFVIPDWGVRCVSDKPWVTIAETCELVMSLATIGNYEEAEILFKCITDKRYKDGAFWTGFTLPEKIIYTQEKTTWTAASVILAADILYNITPGFRVFDHKFQLSHTSPSKLININREANKSGTGI
jgi:hypothetical protein